MHSAAEQQSFRVGPREDQTLTIENLLEILTSNLNLVAIKLSKNEKTKLLDLLKTMKTVEYERDTINPKQTLYDFCMNNSSLKEILRNAPAHIENSFVFRGTPNPKPTSEETKAILLLANRLIDAIEKTDKA